MTKKKSALQQDDTLRKRAEKKVKKPADSIGEIAAEEVTRLNHELQIHQIELEMQNRELQRALEELAASVGKYVDFYNFTPVGYLTMNESGRMLEANLMAATLLDVERSMLVKNSFEQFIHPESRSTFRFFLKNVFPGPGKQSCELQLLRKGKEPLFIALEGMIVTATPGGTNLCRAVMVDITKRKQLEKGMENFSYTIAAHLREPLRAIDGYSRKLVRDLQSKSDDEFRNKLLLIRERTKRMDQLISDVLEFSRLGRLPLSADALDIGRMAQMAWDEIRKGYKERNMSMKISPLPPGYGDERLIRRVLASLIANAVKFTSGRKYATAEVGGQETADACVYWVKDNGIGFDMSLCDKLFQIFSRLHSEEEYEGTGVGLSTVRRIIERHGGRVWAEGEVDKGATFFFFTTKAKYINYPFINYED